MQSEFDLGDRVAIGGNNGPPIDPTEFDPDFISARIIKEAAEYLQFRFREFGLEHILAKRKGKRPMGFRLILSYAIRGLVPSETAARILDINRKTFGENQQRIEIWMNHESDEGAELDAQLEHVTSAVYHHVMTKVPEVVRLVDHFVAIDPGLRALEKEAAAAALAAERAAQAIADRQEARRIRSAGAMKSKLKGVATKEAIVASHKGPIAIAKEASPEALATLAILARNAAKGAKTVHSELNAAGVDECLRLGLAQDAEPHLSMAKDRARGITAFGAKVYMEAIGLDLIEKPKRKPARA